MKHFYALKANHQLLRRGLLALVWLLIGGQAALAQPTTYCTSNLGDYCGVGNGNINLVAITNTPLNNPNTTCNSANGSAYTLWPTAGATTATLLQGLSYGVSVMSPESAIISVWFDWNQNGQFEASEWTQVATASTAGQPATMSVTVPTTATLGLTGMRVRTRLVNNQNGAADACLEFFSGETEDYTVTIGPAPSCAPPTTLAAGAITTTGATLTFSGASNGTATGYVIQYGPAGFTPGGTGSTTINATGTSVPVTGLTANTNYQFYVTKDCGGGQTSIMAGPFTFRTACVTATYAMLPVAESFESTWLDVCNTHDSPGVSWRNLVTTGNTSWRREDDGTTAAWTSPTFGGYTPAGSQGLHSARFHSYTAGAGGTGALDLYADLSSTSFKRLTFDYINTAGNDSLIVEVSTDGGSTFAPVSRYGISGTVAQAWRSQALNINAVSATAIVRFRTKVTTTFTSDIGLDNVRLELGTGCLTPANLTATNLTQNSATLSWLNSGTGTYTVVYGPTGFNPATGGTTISGITGASTTITGLTGSTNYQFYVTQNCAGGTNSGQAGPASFATSIANDDCGGAINVPIQYGTTCVGQTSGDNTFATASANVPAPGCASYVGQDIWFKVTVPASGQVVVQTLPPTGGSSITDTGMAIYSGACGSLTLVSCDDDSSPNGLFSLLTLTGRTPGEVLYIRTWEFGGDVSGLIAVCATSPSNCPLPTGPAAGTLTNTTADLSFTAGGTLNPGDTFEIEYGPTGFTQGTGTTVNNIPGPSYQLTGLQPDTEYCFYVRQNCGAANGSSTWVGPTCFRTPLTVPNNDEPCGAFPLATSSGTVSGTTIGATTSLQNGISLPACSPAASPKDVWFVFTLDPTTTTTTLNLAGTAAGMVRLFTSPDCAGGPFVQVGCQAAATNNAGFPNPVVFAGLTGGQRYWVAVSGFGSSDAPGAFTVSATNTVLGTRAASAAGELAVYPNPSNTGELTLRVAGAQGAGEAALVNALGQVVRRVPVAAGSSEQRVSTRGLAAGVYTLRLTVGQRASATKVVLQ